MRISDWFLLLMLSALVAGSMAMQAAAAAPQPSGPALPMDASSELVCSQPGDTTNIKLEADSAEVANDCAVSEPGTVTKAIWWGGYLEWTPGDPEITRFHVRFYAHADSTPGSLLAAYLSAIPDTFHLGNCTDGLPCFRYELDVHVTVAPDTFWCSVQAVLPEGANDRPTGPKWGRLGDEVFGGSPSMTWTSGQGWVAVSAPWGWDASQEFLLAPPTPALPTTWGIVKKTTR